MLRSGGRVADLIENLRLTTAIENYAWLNTRQIGAGETVNLAARKIHVGAYLQ